MAIPYKLYGSFETAILKKKFPAEYAEFISIDHNLINKTCWKPIEPKQIIIENVELEKLTDRISISAPELADIAKKHSIPLDMLNISFYQDSLGDCTITVCSKKSGPDPKYSEKLEQYLKETAIYNRAIENRNELALRCTELTLLFNDTLKKVMDGIS